MLDFEATSAGETVLRLVYERPFEPGSVTDEWSVTVRVTDHSS